MSFPRSIAVLIKGDIKHPMKIIFNRPVCSHRTLQSLRIMGIQTADKIARFLGYFVIDFSFGRDGDNTLQAFPAMPLLQPSNVGGCSK